MIIYKLFAMRHHTDDIVVPRDLSALLRTGLLPTMLLYFGILSPNNCGSLRRLHHSALLLVPFLHLPCPRISFTLNSKLFSLNNPFLLSI